MNESTLIARKFVTPAALSIAERIKSVCDGENLFDINGAIGIIRHEMEENSIFRNKTNGVEKNNPSSIQNRFSKISEEVKKLWVVNAATGLPVDISSKGLFFYFEDGSRVAITTEDLIQQLKLNIGNQYNPLEADRIEHPYSLIGEAHFPKGFFK